MKYEKPPLSFDQQADQLIRRGMQGNRALIKTRLAESARSDPESPHNLKGLGYGG